MYLLMNRWDIRISVFIPPFLRGNRIKRAQRQDLINNTAIINFLILLSFDSASLLMNLHAIYYSIT